MRMRLGSVNGRLSAYRRRLDCWKVEGAKARAKKWKSPSRRCASLESGAPPSFVPAAQLIKLLALPVS